MDSGHVFVSYSSADRNLADALLRGLEAKGVCVWMAPRDIRPGSDYSESIHEAIEGSSAVIALVSDSANRSRHVKAEIEIAFSRGKPLFPVRFQEVEPAKGLALFLGLRHWTDLFGADQAGSLNRLATELTVRRDPVVATPIPLPNPPVPRREPKPKSNSYLVAMICVSLGVIVVVIALAVQRNFITSKAPMSAAANQLESAKVDRLPDQPMPTPEMPQPSSQLTSADPTNVVTQFYMALGRGDGTTASLLVVPEKRASGPLAAAALSRFYGSLESPLQLDDVMLLSDGRVRARYHYQLQGGRTCDGVSLVRVTDQAGRGPLVAGIESPSRC